MYKSFILSIDQGTSSTKTLIFDGEGKVVSRASEPLSSIYLSGGWVEQDPEQIMKTVFTSVEKCLAELTSKSEDIQDIKVCGISNQRETFVVWDEKGIPLYNAVVWQCKRSVEICERLLKDGMADEIKARTGLKIDPYFSGTKLIWLYENNEHIRKAVDSGKAYFGTIDTWILFKLTNGNAYLSDYTNASRTLFFNLRSLKWDSSLLETFGLTKLNLPDLKPSSYGFGETDFNGLLKSPVKIGAMIGDSHAAAVGEGCFSAGTAKATLGTGSSILMNVGPSLKTSESGMVSTIGWSMEGRVDHAVEGVIVSCGSIIEWLKNQLGLFIESNETEQMAMSVRDNGGVYLIPAFSGLGAPYWQMNRKASINGLTFDSNKNHIVRAALESIAFQIKDIITTMEADSRVSLSKLMVNGGMTVNRFLLQMIADLLGKVISKQGMPDISAQGAAFLAGLEQGIFKNPDHLTTLIQYGVEIKPDHANREIHLAYKVWKSAMQTSDKS